MRILAAFVALGIFGSATAAVAQAPRAKVGALACNLAPTVGFIVGSRQRLSCTYTPDGPFPREVYVGSITTVGLDIGVNGGGRMLWAVFAPTSGFPHGALAGSYVGASADIAVGLGLGANALVGRSHRSFALQPVSVEANTGINIAAGVSELRLHWAR
ncbi:MAG: DUF992 domain-containing protein [Xanthobacteraceae bacterium]